MTTAITLLAVCFIAAGLATFAAFQRASINALLADIDRERARHEVTSELLTEARNEAKNEYELRRQAEKNLAEANEAIAKQDGQLREYRDRLRKYTRLRDLDTGRFCSAKPRPTAQEMNEGLAAFDAMMGNAIEQLQGLTVRKLCDEAKANANEGI